MGVTLSEAAAKHVQNFIAKRGRGIGLRIGVRTSGVRASGCSGMAYKLEFADEAGDDDLQFVSYDVTVLVDPKSLPYIEGMELDYTREGLNEGFEFKKHKTH